MRFHKTLRALRRYGLPIALGGTMFQLQNCSPNVSSAIVTGIQTSLVSFVTTLINVFFLTLQNTKFPTTQQSVQAIFDGMKVFVA